MTDKHNKPNLDPELLPSGQFAEDLAGLHGRGPAIPPEVDDAVMAMARRRLAGRPKRYRVARWASAVAAVAALIAVTWVAGPWRQATHSLAPAPRISAATTKKDIDANGRVDILDAFALARHIEAADDKKREWDINGDGAVNRGDVDLIAMAAVKLTGGVIQ